MLVRLVPILAAFVLGAVVSWWILQPTSPAATEKSSDVATFAPAEPIGPTALAANGPETTVGLPPDAVTPPRPAPNAGQRRALARALDALEKSPPEIEAQELDEETKAAFLAGMRSAIEPTGANP